MENTLDLIIINNKEKNNINNDILKTLKPGGYIFSFDVPSKAHNSVCDIEDIGFLIKDSISYFFKENEDIKQDVICLAMKPLSEKNFAENVMKWGTGGLNIDGCRVGNFKNTTPSGINRYNQNYVKDGANRKKINVDIIDGVSGRYPANFIILEDVAPVLDKQSGTLSAGHWFKTKTTGFGEFGNGKSEYLGVGKKSQTGGASRFFYNAKSYKDLLRYITVLGLPPKESKVLFIGFDNVDEIIEEINKESNVNYEAITIGGVE